MTRELLILREADIRELLNPAECIVAMEQAFTAYSTGRAQLPSVIHLDIPESLGEIHIKAGHIGSGPFYAVKMVSGFLNNPKSGLPANDGIVVVFDAETGSPAALLLDHGFITDFRTGAAGAVAAKYLARRSIETVAVVGTGGQARYQLQMLARVRSFREVRVWGRDSDKARAVVDDLARRPGIPSCNFAVPETVKDAVSEADLIITVTASREPLVQAEWINRGTTIIAVGSDAPDKQELHAKVLARADRIVADSVSQCLRLGEIHHAVEQGAIAKERVDTELGEIVSGAKPGRLSDDEIIVCDLTGVGVQDVAAASLVMQKAIAAGRGQRIAM